MGGRSIKDIMSRVYDAAAKPKPKKIARNTVEYYTESGARRFRLHNTDIVTVSADGRTVTLNTGGWNTVTTRSRMGMILRKYIELTTDYYGCISSAHGGRATTFNSVAFTDSIVIQNGVAVETDETRADAAAAKRECDSERAYARRKSAEKAKVKRIARRDAYYMRAVAMPYEAFQAARKAYRAAVRACAKVSARRIIAT